MSDPRSGRLLLAAAVSGLCAAALAAPAGADDGLEAPADTAPAAALAPAVDAVDATVAEVALEAAEEAAAELDVPEPEDVVEEPAGESGSDDALPVPAEPPSDDNAASGAAPEQQLGEAGIVPSDAGSAGDTTFDSGDTAVGSTGVAADELTAPRDEKPQPSESPAETAPSSAAPSTPAPAPSAALNVNVSVRVGSAGDNGAVTQVNTAATAPSSAPQATSRAPAASSSTTTPEPTTSGDDGSTWYWEWNCLSAPAIMPIPPGSVGGSVPSSWTWIWNCSDNSEQYRVETPDQYQQINANISIRISSPGDNGPVTQTNVAEVLDAALPSAVMSTVELPSLPSISLPSLPAISIPASPISIPALPSLALPMTDALPSFVIGTSRATVVLPGISLGRLPTTPATPRLVLPPVLFGGFGGDGGPELGSSDIGLEVDAVVEVVLGSVGVERSEPVAPTADEVAPAPRGAARRPHRVVAVQPQPPPPTPVTTPTTTAYSAPRIAVAPPATTATPAARATRPAPSWKRKQSPPRPRAPVPSTSGTSASAAGAGGSSGGGLPVFLALPFLVAVLDLARRVALERVTWPSGHRRRMPDTPG